MSDKFARYEVAEICNSQCNATGWINFRSTTGKGSTHYFKFCSKTFETKNHLVLITFNYLFIQSETMINFKQLRSTPYSNVIRKISGFNIKESFLNRITNLSYISAHLNFTNEIDTSFAFSMQLFFEKSMLWFESNFGIYTSIILDLLVVPTTIFALFKTKPARVMTSCVMVLQGPVPRPALQDWEWNLSSIYLRTIILKLCTDYAYSAAKYISFIDFCTLSGTPLHSLFHPAIRVEM